MTKKALFISGGWDGHEPVETSEFISEQIKIYNIESKIVNDLDVMTDLEYLKSFDVILPVWTMGQIDDNNWEIKNSKIGNLQRLYIQELVLQDGTEEWQMLLETIQIFNF